MSFNEISAEILRRINRASINLDLLQDELHTPGNRTALCDTKPEVIDLILDKLQLCQARVQGLGYYFNKIQKLQSRMQTPFASQSEPRRVTRIVPNPVDEVDSGYVNEELAPDHPFFKSVPLTYVHGGPAASCMYCKETFPCGCRTPPPTPPPMSPPPVRGKAKRRPDSPITAADIYFSLRDAQEIPEESYSLSDSQKALLEDSVMQK